MWSPSHYVAMCLEIVWPQPMDKSISWVTQIAGAPLPLFPPEIEKHRNGVRMTHSTITFFLFPAKKKQNVVKHLDNSYIKILFFSTTDCVGIPFGLFSSMYFLFVFLTHLCSKVGLFMFFIFLKVISVFYLVNEIINNSYTVGTK
jgi:hypothetical protein